MLTRLVPLVPADLIIDDVRPQPDQIMIFARTGDASAACPACGCLSGRLHSSSTRHLQDLPWQGRRVVIHARIWRLRCTSPNCPRRVFAERLPGLMPMRLRRTTRLRDVQLHVAIVAGGEPGARLARRLSMPVSGTRSALLCSVTIEPPPAPRIVGIDDWAFRRGQTYGTIVCDLERGRVVGILRERSAEAVAAWLEAHPGIIAVARDRVRCYAAARARSKRDKRTAQDVLMFERSRRPTRKSD